MQRLFTGTAHTAIALALTATAGLAHAQTTPDADRRTVIAGVDTSESVEGEIIVTASKRAENVQDVPVAVQVLSGTQLESQGVREFTDLNRVAPSLVIRPAEHPVNASISIRGVGTYAFGIGVEPSVAVQVDDVPISIQARAFADLQDIERIEVLRGPQSTLYGKAASAGLINIFTAPPSDKFSLRVNVIGTTDEEFGGGISVAGPLGDRLGYRVTGSYVDFRGNLQNLARNGEYLNGRQVGTLRGKLLWEATDNLNVLLSANYINGDTTNARPFIRLAPAALLRNTPGQTPNIVQPGVVVSEENSDVSLNYTTGTDYDGFGQAIKLDYEFPGGPTLLSITAHDRYELNDRFDQDETSSTLIDNRQIGSFEAKQVTQEFRLLSPGTARFRYTLGVFYANNDLERIFFRGPVYALARWDATAGSEQIAAFGQLDWNILPTTTLTGGLRYQHETIDYSFLDRQNGNAFFEGGSKDDFYTYRLAARHEFTDTISAYASYSTGHKGETFDLTTGFNLQRQLAGPIRPETAKSWEVGARTQFMERRLTLNLTLFDTTYDNFQAQGVEFFADGTTNFRLTNVGRVNTRGAEFEVAARPVDDVNISGSVAYIDALIKEFPGAQCYPGQTAAQGCVSPGPGLPARQNLAGFRPAQAPEWKATANFEFSPQLGNLPFRGVLQGTYTYQSRVNYSINQDPQTVQKSYNIVNLGIGIRAEASRYEVMAFVNNLFDEQYYSNLFNNSGNYGNALATGGFIPRDFRRYGGVRASYRF